jgi:hypothetical protein
MDPKVRYICLARAVYAAAPIILGSAWRGSGFVFSCAVDGCEPSHFAFGNNLSTVRPDALESIIEHRDGSVLVRDGEVTHLTGLPGKMNDAANLFVNWLSVGAPPGVSGSPEFMRLCAQIAD